LCFRKIRQTQALEDVVEVRKEDAMAMGSGQSACCYLLPFPSSQRRIFVSRASPGQEDDVEMMRVLKKHCTSLEALVPGAQMFEEELQKNSAGAADLEAFANEEREVDLEGDEWDNLNAEDADDRLMVSEYVVEIFKKEVEVFLHFLVMWH
jgi:hypothetical protein